MNTPVPWSNNHKRVQNHVPKQQIYREQAIAGAQGCHDVLDNCIPRPPAVPRLPKEWAYWFGGSMRAGRLPPPPSPPPWGTSSETHMTTVESFAIYFIF